MVDVTGVTDWLTDPKMWCLCEPVTVIPRAPYWVNRSAAGTRQHPHPQTAWTAGVGQSVGRGRRRDFRSAAASPCSGHQTALWCSARSSPPGRMSTSVRSPLVVHDHHVPGSAWTPPWRRKWLTCWRWSCCCYILGTSLSLLLPSVYIIINLNFWLKSWYKNTINYYHVFGVLSFEEEVIK